MVVIYMVEQMEIGNKKFKILHFNRLLPYIVKKELLIMTEDGTQATKNPKTIKN